VRSIQKFAPWIRHFIFVTNGQVPSWLDVNHPRVTVISHDQIFPNKTHLPTFNSNAIEVHLHRIPELSRRFLYINDDVMAGSAWQRSDFWTSARGHRLYFTWEVPECHPGCAAESIGDGRCDAECRTVECEFDGGDCERSEGEGGETSTGLDAAEAGGGQEAESRERSEGRTWKGSGRMLLDAYGDSLRHSVRVLSKQYNPSKRRVRVPAHMPHMFDREIMSDMQREFPDEFETTSAHRFRRAGDMQMAFSYFNFVAGRRGVFDAEQAVQEADANEDGGLDLNELRTLVARVRTPISDALVAHVQATLLGADGLRSASARHNDRGPMPGNIWPPALGASLNAAVSSQHLVKAADLRRGGGFVSQLRGAMRRRPRYRSEVVSTEEACFLSLSNTSTLDSLDVLRSRQCKFICLNDDFPAATPPEELKAAWRHVTAFYASIVPLPSQMELAPDNGDS